MPHSTRRSLLGAAAALAGTAGFGAPAIAAYPEQPVRVIVPWNAGGLADILIRAMGPSLTQVLGQPVVVENRPGANGAVGTQAVARAAPDGHTLILGNAETHAINPLIYPRLPYDPVRDFAPATLLARGPFALIVKRGLEAQNFAEFLALVRRTPGRISFASWGIGSTSHLAMEALIKQARLEMLHVPFTGAAPASTAIAANQVDCMFLNAGPAEALSRDGSIRILAIGAPERIAQLPQAPTLAELGTPIEASNWFGLLGPARMPAEAAQRISTAVAEALRNPAVQEIFRAQVAIPSATTPAEMGTFIAADRAQWEGVVKDLNIRLE